MINDYVDDDDDGVDNIDDDGVDEDVADEDYNIDDDDIDDDDDDMDGMWFVAGPTRSGRCHRTNLRRRQNLLKMLMRRTIILVMRDFAKYVVRPVQGHQHRPCLRQKKLLHV